MNEQDSRYLKLIQELTDARGASGFEDETVAVARAYAADFAVLRESSFRNLYLRRRNSSPEKPVLMLDAHSDEVGMMVQAIRPSGTLDFLQLGGFTPHVLAGQKVWVRNAAGTYICGVIAAKPLHFMSAAERAAGQSDDGLVIDVGACSDTEARDRFGIRIGEPCVPAVTFTYDAQNGLIFSKALDCRIGCAAMLAAFERLSEEHLSVEPVGTLTAQEEVGERGAISAARVIAPAVAIVFEGAPADDTFTSDYAVQTALKKGPMLRFMDRDMVSHPRFTRFALDLAQRLNIPVQASVRAGGGTNGSVIHVSGDSVPTIVIGIPVRYIHSPHGIAAYEDFRSAVELAVELAKALTPAVLESL